MKATRLPIDFIIAGATKSATSWLHLAISKHPDISVVPNESDFFSTHFEEGSAYFDRFLVNHEAGNQFGDYSNRYIIHPKKVIENIKSSVNDTPKILFSLRNPIDRAYSFYKMFYRGGVVKGTPEEEIVRGTRIYEEGFYWKHIRSFIEAFGEEKILVVLFDDIKSNPENTMKNVFGFLEVKEFQLSDSFYKEAYNKAQTFRPKSVWLHLKMAKLIHKAPFILGETGINLVEKVRKSPLKNVYHKMNRGADVPIMGDTFKHELATAYKGDAELLSDYLNVDLVEKWINPNLR